MLLLTFEGFSPAALSCCGSAFNHTPAVDALAANGTVWDRVITSVTNPVEQVRLWLANPHFPIESCTLVTDDAELSALPEADRIGEILLIEPSQDDNHGDLEEAAAGPDAIEQTHLAKLVAIAAEQIADNDFVWLHSRFLTQCWDAPRWLYPVEDLDVETEPIEHEDLLEPVEDIGPSGIPQILESLRPPQQIMDPDEDPDWMMAWMRTYACQIRLVDAMIALIGEVDEDQEIMVAGTSGFALGQNRAIGHRAGSLRSCQIHVPLIARSGSGMRSRPVMNADEIPTLVNQCLRIATQANGKSAPLLPAELWARQQGLGDSESSIGNTVVSRHPTKEVSVTSENWFYVQDRQADGVRERLFLKPDDLCDINDVSRLRPDVVDLIRPLADAAFQ